MGVRILLEKYTYSVLCEIFFLVFFIMGAIVGGSGVITILFDLSSLGGILDFYHGYKDRAWGFGCGSELSSWEREIV